MVPGQRRTKRKDGSGRFDPRRYRRAFLESQYPSRQRKLLGSHGGKTIKDCFDLSKKSIIENLLEKEATKEKSLLDYHLDEFDNVTDYNWWCDEEEYEEELDEADDLSDCDYGDDFCNCKRCSGQNDDDYNPLDYSDV